MFQLINTIVHEFRKCFKRERTWRWFVVLIMGLMIRQSHKGVTSVISALRMEPRLYHTLLHYFRSTAYTNSELYVKWIEIATKYANLTRIAGRVVLLGDHTNIPKEGSYMTDLEMLHQESQNSGKPEYIAGHNYGHVSAVITNNTVSRSLPLMTEQQKSPPRQEGTKDPDGDTLVVQMVNLVHKIAQFIKEPVVVALDAYFSSERAWSAADKTVTETGEKLIEIVTRAQTNTVGYTVPELQKTKKRGRPRKYGDRVVLYSLFSDMSAFKQTTMNLYGKETVVRYLCLDLIWKPVKKLVRFVMVETGNGCCVLMSTSLTLTAEQIITIYALRFKIEASFDEQKNDMGCFAYHFWSSAQPKFRKWKKSEPPADAHAKTRIENTRRATQSFVCLATIATGILTIIAFSHNLDIWRRFPGWVRTLRSNIPTIAVVKETLAQDFHIYLPCVNLPLFNLIRPLQRSVDFLYQDVA